MNKEAEYRAFIEEVLKDYGKVSGYQATLLAIEKFFTATRGPTTQVRFTQGGRDYAAIFLDETVEVTSYCGTETSLFSKKRLQDKDYLPSTLNFVYQESLRQYRQKQGTSRNILHTAFGRTLLAFLGEEYYKKVNLHFTDTSRKDVETIVELEPGVLHRVFASLDGSLIFAPPLANQVKEKELASEFERLLNREIQRHKDSPLIEQALRALAAIKPRERLPATRFEIQPEDEEYSAHYKYDGISWVVYLSREGKFSAAKSRMDPRDPVMSARLQFYFDVAYQKENT